MTVPLDGERGRTAAALAALWSPLLVAPVAATASIEAACERAAAHAQPGDRVVVFGSFHTVAPALQWRRDRS